MKEKIYDFIEPDLNTKSIYDYAMIIVIILSIVPLMFKYTNAYLETIDKVTVTIFIIDYAARWITADHKLKKGKKSFVIYPFTPMAIVDMLSILPSFCSITMGFKVLRLLRLLRALRVFKIIRYSKNINILLNVIKNQANSLVMVATLALGYIVVSALIVFNVEPNTFPSFFDAIYWATVSLTTVGYGDIYPTSLAGHIVTMFSTFIGIAIVALPSGIITVGYLDEINKEEEDEIE